MLWAVAAWGGSAGLFACCRDVGSQTCPAELQVVGPGSSYESNPSGGPTTVDGVWRLSCDSGATFDKAGTFSSAAFPSQSFVVTAVDPNALACFAASCSLPPHICVATVGERARAVDCTTQQNGDALAWATPSAPAKSAAVVAGRVLAVTSVQGLPASAGPVVVAASDAPSGSAGLDLTVPVTPPDPCHPNAALRPAADSQVDAGNLSEMKSDYATALGKYRAAITIDACDPFAWAALGQTFLELEDPKRAQSALIVATRLMPAHYQAWTNLGQADERLGRPSEAADAYAKALAAHPGFVAADQGLARTRAH